MATHKRLASAKSTTSLALAYTVPANTVATIRQIVITNYSAAGVTFRLATLAPSEDEGDVAQEDYLHYDTALAASSTFYLTFDGPDGLPLGAGYSLAIRGSDTNVNINVFGTETQEMF